MENLKQLQEKFKEEKIYHISSLLQTAKRLNSQIADNAVDTENLIQEYKSGKNLHTERTDDLLTEIQETTYEISTLLLVALEKLEDFYCVEGELRKLKTIENQLNTNIN